MNRSNWGHAAAALLMQIAIGLVTGNWWTGAAAGSFFFLGREHAQFEKKLTHGGPVGALNPLAGFQFWRWDRDSRLDLLFPLVATVALALCLTAEGRLSRPPQQPPPRDTPARACQHDGYPDHHGETPSCLPNTITASASSN